jgi:hypothetical protein
MGGFSADWLALREPADEAARDESVAVAVTDSIGSAEAAAPMVVDLGAGTGANRRYLSRRLPAAWPWRLVDSDRRLLALAAASVRPGERVELVEADLAAADLTRVVAGSALVTASALLDLVSDEWLADLAAACAAARASVLFALTYDGRVEIAPAEDEDQEIVALVNAHQHTDKGFGPALGPDAAGRAADHFAAHGYRIVRARSDWRLGPDTRDLQRALIAGWADAAAELRPDRAAIIAAWRDRRLAHVDAGRSRIVVGHEDVGGIWERRTENGRTKNSR